MKLSKFIPLTLLTMAACASQAHAEVIMYQFTGVVDLMVEKNEGLLSPTEVSSSTMPYGYLFKTGYTVHGTFSYDTASESTSCTGNAPSGSNTTYACSENNFMTLTFDQSGYELFHNTYGSRFIVQNGATDEFTITDGFGGSSLYIGQSLTLADASGSAFSSTGIPTKTLTLADFTSATFNYSYGLYQDYLIVNGHLTSLTRVDVSPVPEPASYGMLLGGLALLGAFARKTGRGSKH
jgi:hypothetical protein